MAKFTVTEELFNTVDDFGQSIGGPNHTIPSGDNNIVVSKERGLELQYENPFNYGGRTTIIEELDLRKTLGTITLNNRDYWENINYNESTFTPYLTDERKTVSTISVEDSNGDEIVYNPNLVASSTYQYSIDALPFVLDVNNDNEIINVDRYWDKKINSNEYYLATEGKINYYLYPRQSGRGDSFGTNYNIDIFGDRGKKTASGGKNRFSVYASAGGGTGYYLFKLDWGDGSPLEYTNQPKLLEGTTLLEHFYEKPGFYTITGTVYASFKNRKIDAYEQFETNILLNPSKNYEFKLYDYDNFASIGGISLDSTLIKSSLNSIGINPTNPSDDQRASSENIEKLNLLDKLQLFNFLNKVSDSFLDKFEDLIEPYTQTIDSGTTLTIFGCSDPNADNYQEGAVENGTCDYGYNITFGLNSGTIKFYIWDLDEDLTPTINEDGTRGNYYLESSILPPHSNQFIGSELTFSRDNLPTSTFENPKIFVRFLNSNSQEIGNENPVINGNLTEFFGIRQLEIQAESDKEDDLIFRTGWYVLETPNLPEPNDEYNRNTLLPIGGQIIFDVGNLEQLDDEELDFDEDDDTDDDTGDELFAYNITYNEVSEGDDKDVEIDSLDLINSYVETNEPYIENDVIDIKIFYVTGEGYDHSPFDVQLRPFITTPENLNIELIEDNSYTADDGTEYRDARYRFTMPGQDVSITTTAYVPED